MTKFYHSSSKSCRNSAISKFTSFNIFSVALMIFAGLFVVSCEEGPTDIGTDILPGTDYVDIKSLDTLSLWTYTMYDDAVETSNPGTSYMGELWDPYFGTTTADFITQIRLGSEWPGGLFTVDSVKLFLELLEVKGDVEVPHYLRISEIAEQLYTDSVYHSNRGIKLTGYQLTDIKLPTLRNDTINNIVLTLPASFGDYLLRDTTKLFYSNTKPDFRSYFKGMLFQIDQSSAPLLASLSVAPPTTLGDYRNVLFIYLHDSKGNTSSYYLILDATNRNAAFNRYFHNFQTATLGDRMVHRNTNYRDTLAYLQCLSGVYSKISLPGLKDLKNDPSFKRIAVNKARITVPVYLDGNIYTTKTVPSNLYLRYKTKSGVKYVVPDYNIDSYHNFFNGRLDTTALKYTFNVPSFIQYYFQDNSAVAEPELEIFQASGLKNVILRANANSIPIKFEFTYTKF